MVSANIGATETVLNFGSPTMLGLFTVSVETTILMGLSLIFSMPRLEMMLWLSMA